MKRVFTVIACLLFVAVYGCSLEKAKEEKADESLMHHAEEAPAPAAAEQAGQPAEAAPSE